MNESDGDKQTIAYATKKLLSLADKYYASAQAGLRYLPFRSRVAIAAALAVYREIGVVLRDRQYDVYQGRVVVSKLRKTRAMTQMLLGLRQWTVRSDKAHEPALHEAIASLRHHSE
ncbi:squalene/phytoene synthase family protein [Veronia nyctiphanis]|uniref:squalene/phytoene synthase family protein n=1 Tax=Veronia nyctiphanis TaxID=1278244 RepID=UPI001375560B|nr:squalene/phytoene synthase family protein [Veronia nyctiphanis]